MATKLNLVIDQGTTYSTSFLVNGDDGLPLNLSSYTINSYIRKTYTSSTYVAFNTSANSTGYVTLSLTSNASSNLVAGRYVYDVEAVSGSNTTSRLVEGIVTVTPQVTR